MQHNVAPDPTRIGQYYIVTLDRIVYFNNQQSAIACHGHLSELDNTLLPVLKQVQDISREERDAANSFDLSKESEVAPLNKEALPIRDDIRQLTDLASNLRQRVVQEQTLGAPIASGQGTAAASASTTPDWPQVVQNNVTRICALLLTVFLVTILVPQYRFNIRMATFYNARSDTLILSTLTEVTGADELSKVARIMTPNIDFGKPPPTPVEQIVEAAKALKG